EGRPAISKARAEGQGAREPRALSHQMAKTLARPRRSEPPAAIPAVRREPAAHADELEPAPPPERTAVPVRVVAAGSRSAQSVVARRATGVRPRAVLDAEPQSRERSGVVPAGAERSA